MITKSNRNPNVSSILAQLQADTHPAAIDFGNISFFSRPYGNGTTLTAQYRDKNGKRKQFYAKTVNGKDAEKAFKAFLIGKAEYNPNQVTVDALFTDFIEHQRGLNRSDGTIAVYRDAWKVLVQRFGNISAGSITKQMAKDFVSHGTSKLARNRKTISPATLHKYVRHLKAVWSYGCENYPHEIESNIWTKLALPIVNKELKDTPSNHDLRMFMASIYRHRKWIYRRLYRVCQIASVTGLRISEIRQIEMSMIDFSENLLRVPARISKSHTSREVHLPKELVGTIKEQQVDNHKNSIVSRFLFPTKKTTCVSYSALNDSLKEVLDILYLPTWKSGFHALRRYAGVSLSRKGFMLETIQKMYGHTNVTMTETYTQHSLRRTEDQIRAGDAQSQQINGKLKFYRLSGLMTSYRILTISPTVK